MTLTPPDANKKAEWRQVSSHSSTRIGRARRRCNAAGAVSVSAKASSDIAIVRLTRTQSVARKPKRSAINPLAIGANTPPTISAAPIVTPKTVAISRGATVSAGIVAMEIGKIPLITEPSAKSANSRQIGPYENKADSGSIALMAATMAVTGRRPTISDAPGTRIE